MDILFKYLICCFFQVLFEGYVAKFNNISCLFQVYHSELFKEIEPIRDILHPYIYVYVHTHTHRYLYIYIYMKMVYLEECSSLFMEAEKFHNILSARCKSRKTSDVTLSQSVGL